MTQGKVLLIYYAHSGSSLLLAQRLSHLHGWPMGEIRLVRPRLGLRGFFRCLVDTMLRRRPSIRYSGPAPEGFETVLVIGPVWARRLASPVRSFLAQFARKLRSVGLISLATSRGAAGASSEAAQLLGRSLLMTTSCRRHEVEANSPAFAAQLKQLTGALGKARSLPPIKRPLHWPARSM